MVVPLLKVGDRIRLIGPNWGKGSYPGVGAIVEVTSINDNGVVYAGKAKSVLSYTGEMYYGYEWEKVDEMAKPIAEFTQGPRPSPTTDLMRISQSSSDPNGIYIQLVKHKPGGQYMTKDTMMHFKINVDEIDDIVVALQYAKFLLENQ